MDQPPVTPRLDALYEFQREVLRSTMHVGDLFAQGLVAGVMLHHMEAEQAEHLLDEVFLVGAKMSSFPKEYIASLQYDTIRAFVERLRSLGTKTT